MPIYLSIFALLALTGRQKSEHFSKFLFAAWILFLILFVGTRQDVGCDFNGYLYRFQSYAYITLAQALREPEFLFSLLNFTVLNLGLDYMWLNVAAATIVFAGFTAFAVRFERPIHFLALAFPILIVQLSMSGIRQAIALSFLMLALNAFRDGNRILTFVFILIGSQFHTSCIIFLPLVFLIGRNPSIWTLAAATTVAIPLLVYFGGERFEAYQQRYSEGEVESLGAMFRGALLVVTAAIFQIYIDRYKSAYPRDFPLMQFFSIASFALIPVLFLSSIAAHRIGFYIMPFHIIMLLRAPGILQPNRRDTTLEMMPFVAYGLYLTVWLWTSRHAQICYIPYQSYLF